MESREGPTLVSSRRRIRYRASAWRVHEFIVWAGEQGIRCAALRVRGALLLWVGAGSSAPPELGEVAAGVPGPPAAASTLLAGAAGGAAETLARRLAAALARPVFVCCASAPDRFTLPLVERGLIAEIKSRPDCFL